MNQLSSKKLMRHKGVTLIELLATLVIIGIISVIAVVSVSLIIERTRVKADESNLEALNEATQNYILYEEIQSEDAFSELNSDYFRIEHLYELGYLDKMIIAQQKSAEFRWDVDTQTWALYGGVNPFNTYDGYDFSTMTLEDAVDDGLTIVNDSRIGYDPEDGYVSILSLGGMLLKDTIADEYSFSIIFSTENLTDTRPVFYFDYNDSQDNLAKGEGFSILFNRKNAFVRLFKMSNGTTFTTVETYNYGSTGVIPTVSQDASWYGEQHLIRFDVSRIDISTKQISIYIDDVFLKTFEYIRSYDGKTVYYGPSVRSNGTDIYIHEFD